MSTSYRRRLSAAIKHYPKLQQKTRKPIVFSLNLFIFHQKATDALSIPRVSSLRSDTRCKKPLIQQQTPDAVSSFEMFKLTTEERDVIPKWAHREYTDMQIVLHQLLVKITRLETNITELENMKTVGRCPRSLAVRVTVNVNQSQQTTMDEVIETARKQFEQTVLAALINARKAELRNLKSEADHKQVHFSTFLNNKFNALQENNVPTVLDDDTSPSSTVEIAQHLFHKRMEIANRDIRTQHFFEQQKKKEQRTARESKMAEDQINQELGDATIIELQRQVKQLQRSQQRGNIRSHSPRSTRKNFNHHRDSQPKTPRNRSPAKFRQAQPPRSPRQHRAPQLHNKHVRRNNREQSHPPPAQKRPRNQSNRKTLRNSSPHRNSHNQTTSPTGNRGGNQKGNRGHASGNPRHRHRSTGSTNRSASKPRSSHPRQN